MSSLSPELLGVAAAYGVSTEFHDWRGSRVDVPEQTVLACLAAMDVDASTSGAASAALQRRENDSWARMLPACLVLTRGTTELFWVHVPHGSSVEVWLELESGVERHGLRQIDKRAEPHLLNGAVVGEATFEIPGDLPLGYHTLHARSADEKATSPLIVTPPWLGLPERMGRQRTWGFATQLYSVRSRQSWGLGDFADLTDLAVWSGGSLGAGYVLVNPLHAAEPLAPMEPSPYLPTSRRFFNPIYLRVERIPEYAELAGSARQRVDRLSQEVHASLDASDTIDRDTSWTFKREALELVYDVVRTPGREIDYRGFVAREGAGLRDFATWSAIAEVHGNDFHSWPPALQDSSSADVEEFAIAHDGAIGFHMWLQWLCDEQLQTAQAKALGSGMPLGVIHDLAVGVHPGGADAWAQRDIYAHNIGVGAPPDGYNQLGQDWSQPPWRPDKLAEQGYAPFRQLLAAVLRHAGGVRVDHILGLFRLWWVPSGQSPSDGTYVTYDHEALIGILALEAHRAGAVVVGEDLGTVEPPVRTYLAGRGILGTSILWFEMESEGNPRPAESWREWCMASVTTHDLPPTAGYLAGSHVRLRDRLGLLTRPLAEEQAAADKERSAWLEELRSRGLLGPAASIDETLKALHRYLVLTPARLLGVALVDAVGDKRTQNQPGTSDEYPNWRVPLSGPDGKPVLLEDVITSIGPVQLAELITGVRASGGETRC